MVEILRQGNVLYLPAPSTEPAPQLLIDFNAPFAQALPEKWKIVSHRKTGPPGSVMLPWKPELVRTHLWERQKQGGSIPGIAMQLLMCERPVWNANLITFFWKHPEEVPDILKQPGCFFCIWGTIFETRWKHFAVPILEYDEEKRALVTRYQTLWQPFDKSYFSLEVGS